MTYVPTLFSELLPHSHYTSCIHAGAGITQVHPVFGCSLTFTCYYNSTFSLCVRYSSSISGSAECRPPPISNLQQPSIPHTYLSIKTDIMLLLDVPPEVFRRIIEIYVTTFGICKAAKVREVSSMCCTKALQSQSLTFTGNLSFLHQ